VDHHVAVDMVELEPEVVSAFRALWPDHEAYLHHAGVRVMVNDGRNFVLTSRESYDVVIVDGTPPIYSAGTVNLYSREFVDLARRHLTPTGMLALWVPLPCFDSDFGMILRNFTEVFPHTVAWQQPGSGLPGVLLLGSQSPFDLDPKAVDRRARERDLAAGNPWLNGGLLAPGRVIGEARLRQISAGYLEVTDDRPGTEFPLPRFLERAPLRRTPESLLQ
jgi:spermidine synthase